MHMLYFSFFLVCWKNLNINLQLGLIVKEVVPDWIFRQLLHKAALKKKGFFFLWFRKSIYGGCVYCLCKYE